MWQVTESEPDGTYDDIWGKNYKHRKYTALLNKSEFQQFVDKSDLVASTVETMGSLGAPSPDGMVLGIVPAVCFDYRSGDYELNAYVTPYVVRQRRGRQKGVYDSVRKAGCGERDWDRLRDAIIAKWSDHPRHLSRIARYRSARLSAANPMSCRD